MKAYFVVAAISCMYIVSADKDADSACAECLFWNLEFYGKEHKGESACRAMQFIQEGKLCFTCDNDTIAIVCGGVIDPLTCDGYGYNLNCQTTEKDRACIKVIGSTVGELKTNCTDPKDKTCESAQEFLTCELKSPAFDVCPKQTLQFVCVTMQTFGGIFGDKGCNLHCPSMFEATETARRQNRDDFLQSNVKGGISSWYDGR